MKQALNLVCILLFQVRANQPSDASLPFCLLNPTPQYTQCYGTPCRATSLLTSLPARLSVFSVLLILSTSRSYAESLTLLLYLPIPHQSCPLYIISHMSSFHHFYHRISPKLILFHILEYLYLPAVRTRYASEFGHLIRILSIYAKMECVLDDTNGKCPIYNH